MMNDKHQVLYYVEGHAHEDWLGSRELAIQNARAYLRRGYKPVTVIHAKTGETVDFVDFEGDEK